MDSKKLRILFVDDEPSVLRMIELVLRPMALEWESDFAESGKAALDKMAQKPFDVVISDMRMPSMSGAELLNEVLKRHPQTIRIILSGFADEEMVMKCVGATHQYLSKPFDTKILKAALTRIQNLSKHVNNGNIKKRVNGMSLIPSMPTLYYRIIEALQSPHATVQTISEIVETDPGLTAKLLQLVNSAFFGYASNISNAVDAVQLLGLGRIRSLALTLHIFSAFDRVKFAGFSIENLWRHSLETGLLARGIMELESGNETAAEQAFTAGLLHDIGILLLASNFDAEYRGILEKARHQSCPLVLAEKEALSVTHADVGAYLLGVWGLPMPLVEATAWHHEPAKAGEAIFNPLTAVHVANGLHPNANWLAPDATSNLIDMDYLSQLGLTGRLPIWKNRLKAT